MARVMETHELWWEGKLDRPLVHLSLGGRYPAEGSPRAPWLSQATCADFSWSAEEIVDTFDWALSQNEYMGDAYPSVNFDAFGPGVLAAFCGARLDNSSGRVWFWPAEDKPISGIHAVYDPENKWAKRIRDIYRAGVSRWEGRVIMGMPDLGGILDAAASLVGTENLLYALIDEPEEVDRLVGELETAWHAAYRDFAAVLAPQGGFTDWNGLLSKSPAYVLQCDFCYMIGQEAFRRFVLGTLRRDTEKLTHTIYHLDGIGELIHLDDILSLPRLNAVQWVYGAGKPGARHWLDVYRKIMDAGKQIMIIDGVGEFFDVWRQLGGTPYARWGMPAAERDRALALLREIGIREDIGG